MATIGLDKLYYSSFERPVPSTLIVYPKKMPYAFSMEEDEVLFFGIIMLSNV